jgi:hypothetical protein
LRDLDINDGLMSFYGGDLNFWRSLLNNFLVVLLSRWLLVMMVWSWRDMGRKWVMKDYDEGSRRLDFCLDVSERACHDCLLMQTRNAIYWYAELAFWCNTGRPRSRYM